MARLTFSENGWDEYIYWQSQDLKTLKKINKLLKEVQRTPFKGSGKPEPLKKPARIHGAGVLIKKID